MKIVSRCILIGIVVISMSCSSDPSDASFEENQDLLSSSQCGTAEEGGNLTITCPSGQSISNINFSSYGTPNGRCGSFSQGSCHASNSSSITANNCLGKSSCSIAATNNAFGDPCRGIYKRLFVQAACSNSGSQPPGATCSDKVKNGSETDVDCGGPTCSKCLNGKACNTSNDCSSNGCLNNVCQAGSSDKCNDLASYGPNNRPPACWKPYSPTGPYNRRVPANPKIDPRSASTVKVLIDDWTWFNFSGGAPTNSRHDCGFPVYWLAPGVPATSYTILCRRVGGNGKDEFCHLHNKTIRIPNAAIPEGCGKKGDGHMSVVDAEAGVVYDFYRAFDRPPNGGTWDLTHNASFEAWAGVTALRIPNAYDLQSTDGLVGGCTAGNNALLSGLIRTEELLEQRIDHALSLAVSCIGEVSKVYPTLRGGALPCDLKNYPHLKDMPATGARIWLAASESELNSLPLTPIQRTIFKTLAKYGAYVTDTGGGNRSVGLFFQIESAVGQLVYNQPNPWDTPANALPGQTVIATYGNQGLMKRGPPTSENLFYTYSLMHDGDGSGPFSPREFLRQRLRVLDPCVAEGDCTN